MMALFRNFKNEVLNMSLFLGLMSLKCAKKECSLYTTTRLIGSTKKNMFTKFWNDVRNTQHETRCWIFFSFSKLLITFCCKLQYIFYHVFYYLLYIKAWNLLSLRLSGLKALGCISKYHKFHSFFIIVICCLYLLHKWVFD